MCDHVSILLCAFSLSFFYSGVWFIVMFSLLHVRLLRAVIKINQSINQSNNKTVKNSILSLLSSEHRNGNCPVKRHANNLQCLVVQKYGQSTFILSKKTHFYNALQSLQGSQQQNVERQEQGFSKFQQTGK